jgi:TolB-like protein/Flp pilus assembly protein TadD
VKEAGQLVRRADLIEAVWPDTVVEDNNLSVNISLLRKALGENNGGKYIETVSRRGYRFTAQVRDAYTNAHASARTLPIAVLPFKQNTAQKSKDYLGIGLCDTLITRLSNVSRFAVRPTSTVVRYAEDRIEPLAAGRELKVDYVVDGRIRRAGEILRVNVQLLRISEEAICWAGQFDEKLTDVLQLEDSIAEQVALALIPQMTAAERERLAKRGTDNAEAFEAYLRGRFHFNSLTEDGFAKALAAYESAVKLDPSYALAYTGIADYYYFLAVWGVMPSDKCLAACEAAARRAIEIDPNLAEAHAALGFALSGRFKWAEGERHVLRALELSPNSALAHLRYGNHLVQQGFVEEAVQQARRSIELDPLSPVHQFSLGWGLYFARRFEEALEQYQSTIRAHPLNPMAHFGFAWVARYVGRHDEALSAMKRAEELSNGSFMMMTGRGTVYAAAGMRREAEQVLENIAVLPAQCYVIPYHIALIYHFLGDKEKTLLVLEEAFEQRDLWLVWIGVEPAFDNLRSDTRFRRLLELTGLGRELRLHTGDTRAL